MWRISVLVLIALLLCGFAVWGSRSEEPYDRADTRGEREEQAGSASSTTAPARTAQRHNAVVGRVPHDVVVLSPCSLVAAQEQDVSSQVDGVFREIRVGLGDRVTAGQVLGRLDDGQLRVQMELLGIRAASRSAELIAKAQHDEADKHVAFALKANQSGVQSVSDLEYQGYLAQRERHAQEMEKAREEQQVARKELERARNLLSFPCLGVEPSQEGLAAVLRTFIGSVERGERNVSVLNLRLIARVLRISLVDLMNDLS